MIPIALAPATVVAAPVPPVFRQAGSATASSFSALFDKATDGVGHDRPEASEPKPAARKTTARQIADPRTARTDALGMPVQVVPGHQLKPIQLRVSFSFEHPEDEAHGNNRDAAAEAPGNTEAHSSDGAAPQQGGATAPVAFSVNLQELGTPNGNPALQSDSSPNADISAQSGDASQPETDSRQPGTEEHKTIDLKVESTMSLKQDGFIAIHPDTQSLPAPANTAICPGGSLQQQQSPGKGVTETLPVAPPEPAQAPTPVAPRYIDVTVPNHDGRQVDVRISQRAGEFQVTVPTPDSTLAQSLRQHLPELSQNLLRNGFRGDFFQHQPNNGDTPNDGDRQNQRDQDPKNQPPAKGRAKDRESGSFAEIIHVEKRNT